MELEEKKKPKWVFALIGIAIIAIAIISIFIFTSGESEIPPDVQVDIPENTGSGIGVDDDGNVIGDTNESINDDFMEILMYDTEGNPIIITEGLAIVRLYSEVKYIQLKTALSNVGSKILFCSIVDSSPIDINDKIPFQINPKTRISRAINIDATKIKSLRQPVTEEMKIRCTYNVGGVIKSVPDKKVKFVIRAF